MQPETITETKQPPPTAKFAELLDSSELLEAVTKLGFTDATPVQTLTIPPAIQGRDLVVQAKTGSGKTLAFGLPMMTRLIKAMQNGKIDYTFGFVLVPTRELGLQISQVLAELVPGVNPVLLIGGMPYPKQQRMLEDDPRIVIGTPGRVLDFIEKRYLKLGGCEFFALDEADEMFGMGFFEDVERILREVPEKAQGLFVSATISPKVVSLAQKYLREAQRIEAESPEDEKDLPPIEHLYCEVGPGMTDKPSALCDLIEFYHPHTAIIFCNTKSETEVVEAFLRRRGFDARRLNSDLAQSQRNRIMDRIRAGELRFLVATDIAARGIDIAQIELVINMSMHDLPELYVHRTGRTGRAGRKGTALSLISAHDFMAFRTVRKELTIEFKKVELPTEPELAAARLAHLEEALSSSKEALRSRDLALAQRILSQYGGIEGARPELIEYIAKLSNSVLENLVAKEAVSLEEELERAAPPARVERDRGSNDDRRRSSGGGDRGRDQRRDSRGSSRSGGGGGRSRDRGRR